MGTNPPLPLKSAAAIVGLSLILGFLFDYLLWEKVPGIGFSLFILSMVLAYAAVTIIQAKKLRTDVALLLVGALFFAAMVGVRANELLIVLNIGAVIGLALLIAEVNVRASITSMSVIDYLRLVFPPIQYLDPMLKSVSGVMAAGKPKNRESAIQIIRGIAMALPVVVILLALFASADPTFERFFTALFNTPFFDSEYPIRILIDIGVAAMLIGAYSYAMGAHSTVSDMFATSVKKLGTIEVMILLGSVTAVFAAFVAVQASYFFGGTDYIASQGLTYAEYARRGFFELNVVCVLAWLVLMITEQFIDRGAAHSPAFKSLSASLVTLVLLVMTSSFYKIYLYESVYGFTTLRLYSHAFVILLAITFVSLLYKIFIDIRNETFALRTFLSVALFVAAMNLLNPDAYIASKNIARYEATGKIDVEHITTLSEDAVPELIRAAAIVDTASTTLITENLQKRAQQVRKVLPWQSQTLSRKNAARALTNVPEPAAVLSANSFDTR
ncbi:MAG: DUF4173 domain-containing protein [Candidatus Pacebacteria bacterium]|nr:DUF4173 domain-containing protein [Candidatus Paceibacterota bacterium]